MDVVLDLLMTATESGEVRTLPLTWAQTRRDDVAIERAMSLRS